MRASFFALVSLMIGCLTGCSTVSPESSRKRTFSSFDQPASTSKEELGAGTIKFVEADLSQVLAIYQELSGRTVVRPTSLPQVKITVTNQQPLDRIGALQLLDTALAENGIAMVLLGDVAVKAVPTASAHTECAPVINLPVDQLPNSSSYMMRVVKTEHAAPSSVVQALIPLAKLPNSILAIDDARIIVLRDYASNIRQMLHLLEELDTPKP